MRRKLNEGEEFNEELLDGVKICVSDIRNDDSEMDCNELRDIFVEAGAENSVAAGCVSAAISMLYLESADAAIPVGAFAGYAVRSWLRHLFGGTGELDGCVPADPD